MTRAEPPARGDATERTRSTLGKLLRNWDCTAARAALPVGVRLLATRLARFATMDTSVQHYVLTGEIWIFPSVETLAKEVAMTRRGVQMALRRLEAAGLIEIERSLGGAHSATNKYRLVPQPELRANPGSPVGANKRVVKGRTGRYARGEPGFAQILERSSRKNPRGAAPDGARAPRSGAGRKTDHRIDLENVDLVDDDGDEDEYGKMTPRFHQSKAAPIPHQVHKDEDEDDDETRYRELKRQSTIMSKTKFLALVDQHRDRGEISAGDRASLRRLVGARPIEDVSSDVGRSAGRVEDDRRAQRAKKRRDRD